MSGPSAHHHGHEREWATIHELAAELEERASDLADEEDGVKAGRLRSVVGHARAARLQVQVDR